MSEPGCQKEQIAIKLLTYLFFNAKYTGMNSTRIM